MGEQVQFDMKEKVKLIDINGNETIAYIPTLTLSWSRYNYRKLILQPTTENLLCFLAQAFEDICGVPKEIVIDNLKAFVESLTHHQMIMQSLILSLKNSARITTSEKDILGFS